MFDAVIEILNVEIYEIEFSLNNINLTIEANSRHKTRQEARVQQFRAAIRVLEAAAKVEKTEALAAVDNALDMVCDYGKRELNFAPLALRIIHDDLGVVRTLLAALPPKEAR